MRHTVLITGASGYIGAMLVARFAARADVERVIGIDKEPGPDPIARNPKVIHIQTNTADPNWEARVRGFAPDVVVHAAWQIRELYGKQDVEWRWNIDGSDRVFDFAFGSPSVRRLIYFSTVASYGAFANNIIEHRFTEDEPFRRSGYRYAEEKCVAEEHLRERFLRARAAGSNTLVSIVRPAAITGPRGRFMRVRFGLQAALSGQLRGSFVYRLVSGLVSFVPVTARWCRQFIHEDDAVGIVDLLAFGDMRHEYEAFNISPSGPVVRGKDIARAVGKRTLPIHPLLIRAAFFVMWHLTGGRVPTGRGAWRGYSYPVVVDGSKITRMYGFNYTAGSYDAFYYTNGRYEEDVPETQRRHKPDVHGHVC